MKRLFTIGLAASLAVGAIATAPAEATGNGAPSGSHYTLNIIGVPKDKTADMTDSSRHTIFVPIEGASKILLQEGAEFQVLDGNATDGNGGKFQLPDPGLAFDWETLTLTDADTSYSAYARALGTPGGWATLTTCAEIADTFDLDGRVLKGNPSLTTPGAECSLEQASFTVDPGSKFENVTADLTTLVLNVVDEVTGAVITQVRVPIFDDAFESVFWEYDNHGLKVLQIRFYPCSTNVVSGATTCAA